MRRRVVITGTGAVSCFGVGTEHLTRAIAEGRSGIGAVRGFDMSGFVCPLAAELPDDFSVRDWVPKRYRKATKVMARDIEIAVAAARAATLDAGLVTRHDAEDEGGCTYPSGRVGCQIGAGLIAADVNELAAAFVTSKDDAGDFDYGVWGSSGMANLTPLWLLKYLPNMLACHVTIIHEAQGPSNTITNAQASGLLSLGESRAVIERGDADCCISGAAESKLNPMGLERLRLSGLLDAPSTETLEPYNPASTTAMVGEGGGILILEELGAAEARGAKIKAEIIGFGGGHSPASGTPEEKSAGLRIAITNALRDAGIDASAIDAVFPEAAGAPVNDLSEAHALREVFGDRLASMPVVATTPAAGHAVAGNAAISACVAAESLSSGVLPAHLESHTPASLLGLAPAAIASTPVRTVLLCTTAMGGQNAAVILRAL